MLVASQVAPGKPQILHYPDLSDEDRQKKHGVGTHTPIVRLTVGETTTVTFEWTIGEQPVVEGGELLVVWNWPFDWSDLQSDENCADGFMHVEYESVDRAAASAVELTPRYNWIAGIEPWHHQIQLRVHSGELQPGDRIRLTCRDWRAPTCVADRCKFLMLIDHLGDGTRSRLVQQPSFRVEPGPAVGITATIESDAVAGEAAEIIVLAQDCWGNPTELESDPVVDAADVEAIAQESTRPSYRFRATFSEPGLFRVNVSADDRKAVTNPITVTAQPPERSLFWGDLHSGQTEIGCGAGSVGESYAFGRDCAGLKFMTHQANDHYVTVDEWRETRRVTDEHHESGRFVPILGCEWSPLTKDGGDRNVFYRNDEPVLRRSDRFFREDVEDPEPDVRTAPEFHDAFRDLDVLVNIHVGGRMTNLEWYEQKIERLCETHSTHGTVEWFFMDALARGYRVGLTAGTDGVMGRPGADHPGRRLIRNLRNGLTAVYAKELTRESLWEALYNRRTYATTGERIRLWFEVDGSPMGSEIETSSAPSIRFSVTGTKAIERVDLFRGVEVIDSWSVTPRQSHDTAADSGRLLRVLWGGTERKGTARLQRVNWDGALSIDSGTIDVVEPVNFQSIADSVHNVDGRRIEWQSQTAGNAAGMIVRVDADDSAILSFESEPKRIQQTVGEACTSEVRCEAGGVNRFVAFGSPPTADGPQTFEFETTDDADIKGEFIPYWIRVTQIDQSLAWSSPVYVTRR